MQVYLGNSSVTGCPLLCPPTFAVVCTVAVHILNYCWFPCVGDYEAATVTGADVSG